jgi:ketosteroid isomerase-like protein
MATAHPSEETRAVIDRFNEAFNRHDVDAIMSLMTDDCIFENTSPAPDGERFEGQEAVRGFWERMFASAPTAHFETEELFPAGDRCVGRWRYSWADANGAPQHVRGVDLFRVRDGRVAEKLSYVKG